MPTTTQEPLISIIVRSKNEERWIAACLSKIKSQTIQNVEVILVDNGSTDKTMERAKAVYPEVKIVEIDAFLPGKAINDGIRASSGEYIVCISSHCVPQNDDWLETLLNNFKDDDKLAGVYGRQIPMQFTSANDARDLIVTFGLDKRIQKKDPFFHNANSIIPRLLWEKYPFDEEVTNIEDRVWAKTILAKGYHLIYEPEASVYHHHGIHHGGNVQRARNIVKIMEPDISPSQRDEHNPFNPEKMNINAILTVREDEAFSQPVLDSMIKKTIRDIQECPYINRIIVSTDSARLKKKVIEWGGEVPFTRPDHLAGQDVRVISVLQHALEWMENHNIFSDYIVLAEITHPFRPKDFISKCIDAALTKGLETSLASVPEYRPCWWMDQDEYHRIDDYIHKRDSRDPLLIGLPALCCVTVPSLIRGGERIGKRSGVVELHDVLAAIQIRSDEDYKRLKGLQIFLDDEDFSDAGQGLDREKTQIQA